MFVCLFAFKKVNSWEELFYSGAKEIDPQGRLAAKQWTSRTCTWKETAHEKETYKVCWRRIKISGLQH